PSWRARADDKTQRLARLFVEGFNAADAKKVSSVWLACQNDASEQVDGERLFHLRHGYDRIVETLVERLLRAGGELRFGVEVRRIAWGRRVVDIAARRAMGDSLPPIRGRVALITLPVGVLQAQPGERGAVRFSPALPAEKRTAIRALPMGPVVKFLLRLQRVPPPIARHGITFLHVPAAPVPTFWLAGPEDVPVLVGWCAGPAVAKLPLDESSRLRAAIASLAKGLCMPRSAVARELEAWRIFDWQREPFSRGAYSYVAAGALDAPARLAAPLDDTLFFAGEATHPQDAGTVHGAIASGQRAAREIADRWR
ncbi:MAG TPA: NAD(P)/FAD-dependent oxidoreductase, partial [Polyangiaceae bacterium]